MILPTVFLTCVCYSLITVAVHYTAAALFPLPFNRLELRKQLQFDFRGMRIFAGLKCSLCFFYGVLANHDLGLTGSNPLTLLIFESYLGYTIFELLFMYCCSKKTLDMIRKPHLRLLVLHHVLVGSAAYVMCKEAPVPHYLGLLTLGNEAVVISYALVQMATMLGYKRHPVVKFNLMFLPIQYTVRQGLFFYISYLMVANYQQLLVVCPDWISFLAFFGGMNLLGLVINPYWTLETYQEAYLYYREESQEDATKTKIT